MTITAQAILGGYTFTQVVPSTTWNIVHSLNTLAPVLDCWVDDGGSSTKIIPVTVAVIDESTVQITFSTTRAGVAYVV